MTNDIQMSKTAKLSEYIYKFISVSEGWQNDYKFHA